MIYKHFDIEFLKRYFDLLSKHKRSISTRYGNKCEKEMFVKRTFHKWFAGRYFVYIKHEETGVYKVDNNDQCCYDGWNRESIKRPKKHFVYISGINYALTHSDDITFMYNDPFESYFINDIRLDFNELHDLQFYEISKEKYKEISTLFDDDREDVEFLMKAVSKNAKGKYKETTVKTFGKDYSEARKNAIKNNPTMIIYG